MHENLHKNVNENVDYIFIQIFLSFYEWQLKQHLLSMVFNHPVLLDCIKFSQLWRSKCFFPKIQQAPSPDFIKVG